MANMKTIDQIHRDNLAILASENGNASVVAAKIGVSDSQFSQWLNASKNSGTGKPRGMRPASCRKIEEKCGKPSGWMDTSHAEVKVAAAPELTIASNSVSLTTAPDSQEHKNGEDEVAGAIRIAMAYRSLSPESRKHLADHARKLLEQDERARNNGHERRETTREMDDGVLRKHGLGR